MAPTFEYRAPASPTADPGRATRACRCLVAGLVVLVLLGVPILASRQLDPGVPAIQQVNGIASADPQPPIQWSKDLLKGSTLLPRRFCKVGAQACYDHYRLLIPASPEPQALFLPGFSGSVAIRLNGERLATYGTLTPPMERLVFRPQLLRLPTEPTATDHQELVITIGADAQQFLRLEPFYVGPVDTLTTTWRVARWLSVDILRTSMGIYLILGLLALLSYWQAGRRAMFLWFAGIVVCASLRNLYFLWTTPGHEWLREVLYAGASLTLLACSAGFAGSIAQDSRERLYQKSLVVMAATTLVLGWLIAKDPYEGTYQANSAVRLFGVLTGLWVTALLWRYLQQDWHPSKPWILALFIGAFALVLHDVSPVWTGGTVLLQLSNLSPLLLVLAFCLILALELSRALNLVATHNRTLRAAVAKREAELDSAHLAARQAERQSILAAERERILKDMHDGVGGRLAGLIMMARRRQEVAIAEHLEESLTDLRLMIDSLDDVQSGTISETIALFVDRAKPGLQQHGIELLYSNTSQLKIPMSATARLHLLRILQEASNNVVRHAQASTVTLQVHDDPPSVRIVLQDDGHAVGPTGSGRGIANMRQRAEQLEASFEWHCDPVSGTRITLSLPATLTTPVNMGGDGARAPYVTSTHDS